MTNDLFAEWLECKAAEAVAVERRRQIEDELAQSLRVAPDHEGTTKFDLDGYEIKVTGRMNRKVNADLVQEIAAEHGHSHHLQYLFRWKPELDAKAWQKASHDVTSPLLAAITTTPARPSFSIAKKED